MSEKILDIKDERLSFFTPAGEVKALNGVSFTMNQGDVLGRGDRIIALPELGGTAPGYFDLRGDGWAELLCS